MVSTLLIFPKLQDKLIGGFSKFHCGSTAEEKYRDWAIGKNIELIGNYAVAVIFHISIFRGFFR